MRPLNMLSAAGRARTFRAKIIALFCLCTPSLTGLAIAQDEPWDRYNWGAEESTRVMFNPARRILFRDGDIDFLASELRYTFRSKTGEWQVSPNEGSGMPPVLGEIHTRAGRFAFSAPEPGVLEIRGDACGSEPLRLRLWTAADLGRVWLQEMQQRMSPPPKSAQDLAQQMTVSEPQVMGWDEGKQYLWLGIGFYAGEGSGGIGTLVQLDKATCKVRVHQPLLLGTASITHLARWKSDLWLATGDSHESGWEAEMGLVRYNPRSGHLETFPKESPLAEAFLTAMARQDSTLWLATPGRFFALNMHTRALRAWRIVPRLELTGSRAVTSQPGGKVRGTLDPGVYEVRWVGPDVAEILTPDCAEGFAGKGWVADTRISGSLDLDEIAISYKWGNPSSLKVYSVPVDLKTRPKSNGWFLRVPVVPLGSPQGDWQRARVCAGWVKARPDDVRLSVEEVR